MHNFPLHASVVSSMFTTSDRRLADHQGLDQQMTNHPNRSKISQASWLDANDNAELVTMAADLALDALAAYYSARDLTNTVDVKRCREVAADEAYKGRRGWEYAAADENDPAGELAWKVLGVLGFERRSGDIGFDATIQPRG